MLVCVWAFVFLCVRGGRDGWGVRERVVGLLWCVCAWALGIVLALGVDPWAVWLGEVVRSSGATRMRSVGATTSCMIVGLPHPHDQ